MGDDGDPWRKRMKRQGATRVLRWITFSCERRLPLFKLAETKDAFVEALLREVVASRMGLVAFVVMPEHVHLVLSPESGDEVEGFLRRLKSRFARETLAAWTRRWPEAVERLVASDGSRRFWLRGGGYDRSLWRAGELAEKIAYCHWNPVRRGLVNRPREWRWSSAGIAYPLPSK